MAFTFFFRDEQTLKVLLEHALPVMQGQAFIRIWDAGCAHGPEPYTLAILLRERMSEMLFRNVRIHATDMERQFEAQVVSGIFPEEELRRVPADLFERYFRPAAEPNRFQVVDEVRSRIEFTRHDLLSLVPVRQDLSLIVCKNVLLHFNERQRCDVLRTFHGSVAQGWAVGDGAHAESSRGTRPPAGAGGAARPSVSQDRGPSGHQVPLGFRRGRTRRPARWQAPAALRIDIPRAVGRLTQPLDEPADWRLRRADQPLGTSGWYVLPAGGAPTNFQPHLNRGE